jgi:hypothetical protein
MLVVIAVLPLAPGLVTRVLSGCVVAWLRGCLPGCLVLSAFDPSPTVAAYERKDNTLSQVLCRRLMKHALRAICFHLLSFRLDFSRLPICVYLQSTCAICFLRVICSRDSRFHAPLQSRHDTSPCLNRGRWGGRPSLCRYAPTIRSSCHSPRSQRSSRRQGEIFQASKCEIL